MLSERVSFYILNEAHKQYSPLDTIFHDILYFGPPGTYLFSSRGATTVQYHTVSVSQACALLDDPDSAPFVAVWTGRKRNEA